MLRRFTITTALLATVATLWTAQAMAATGIGHAAGDSPCGQSVTIFQTGVSSLAASYTVPSGQWVLSSWSTQAGPSGGQMAAVVVRPTGVPNQYSVVGVSATETLTPNTLDTFSTAIPVQAGDLLGEWVDSTAYCANGSGNPGDTYSFSTPGNPLPSAGDTFSTTNLSTYTMDIAGTLTPAASVAASSLFVCYSKWEQDGGAVFQLPQALQLLAAGYWLPTAVPGTVDGGTNVGDYHLVCNPPPDVSPTDSYVGDGGDVVDASYAESAGAGYYRIAD